MFIQELHGAWMDHPFWKKAFLLVDQNDLIKLKSSPIKEVVIDTAKGFDVDGEPKNITSQPVQEKTQEESTQASAFKHPKPALEKIKRIIATEECVRAKRILNTSKHAVSLMFHEVRMGKALNAKAAMPLVEEISASVSRNESALISLVRLKSRDDYTYMHSVAVCALMVALAKELNLSDAETKQAGLAGLMHDIGKAVVPLDLLNKPGALTNDEFELIKQHPSLGHQILLQANFEDQITLDVCLHHHEKVDGHGYPDGLQDGQISFYAKMGAVCDVYDAVTSNRP